MNNVLKLKVDRKSQSLTEFVDLAQELVLIYEKNIERAFSHRGDWRLSNLVKFDSEAKSKRVLKECLCNLSVTHPWLVWLVTLLTKVAKSSSSGELSVSYDVHLESGCKIHKDTLKAIWQKASSLVADTTLIAAVPGGANLSYDRMVASTSSNCLSTPAKFTGQFKCDSKCPMFSFVHILLQVQR